MIRFTVPGEARGKGRARHGKTRQGKPITYSDDATVAYEGLVKWSCAAAMGARPPLAGPVSMMVFIHTVPPASTSKAKRALMLEGRILPAKKPDASNVLKAIEDGLNKVAYLDDAQIVSLIVTKTYAETAGVDVTIAELCL